MLQNAYFLANIGADTAENEQHFADGRKRATFCRRTIRLRVRLRPGGRRRDHGEASAAATRYDL